MLFKLKHRPLSQNQRDLHQAGFSLAELMVSVAVGGVLAIGLARMFSETSKRSLEYQAIMTKDDLVNTLRWFSVTPEGLRQAMKSPQNSMFRNCVAAVQSAADAGKEKEARALCIVPPPGKEYDLSLFPKTKNLTDSNRIAGPDVFYTKDGARCSLLGKGDCVVAAHATFTPVCQGGAQSCERAVSVQIHIEVKQEFRISSNKNFEMRPYIANESFFTEEIDGGQVRMCPPGTKRVGRDEHGLLKCEKSADVCSGDGLVYAGIRVDGSAECVKKGIAASCGAGEASVGTDSNGKPLCRRLPWGLPGNCREWRGTLADDGTVGCLENEVAMGVRDVCKPPCTTQKLEILCCVY